MDIALSSKRGHDQVAAAAAAPAPSEKQNESNNKRPKASTDHDELMLCAGKCKEWKKKSSFSKNQKRKGANAKCPACANGGTANTAKVAQVQEPLILTCSKCKKEKQKEDYSNNYWQQGRKNPDNAICTDCNPKMFRCVVCKKSKSKNRGTLSTAELAKATSDNGEDVTCQECETIEYRRKLAQPRECSNCEKIKPKQEYSSHQWSSYCYDGKQTCKDCYPPEKEEADREEEHRKEKQQELIKLAAQGVYFYRFDPDTLATITAEPKPANLEGSYSIIFHRGFCAGQDEASRTAKGTLTFAPNPESKLVGQIEFDESFPAGNSVPFNPTYKIVPTDNDDDKDDEEEEQEDKEKGLEFQVEDLVDPDNVINPGDDELFSWLTVVTERVGLPWTPYEYRYTNDDLAEKFYNERVVKFSNLEEAEALTKRYEERTPPSWIHDHLGQEIAKRIYEYIPRGPPPVFFLEPGDLCLYTLWNRDFHEGDVASYIIARKIEPKSL